MKLAGLFALGLTLFLVGCGKPGLGDECDVTDVGVADTCSDTNVCGKGPGNNTTCQQACVTTADCPTNSDCMPATGVQADTAPLACRPR